MANSYSHLFRLPTAGLLLSWGQPDMALLKFTHNILPAELIDVFNNSKFTCTIKGLIRAPETPAMPNLSISKASFCLLDIGDSDPVKLVNCTDELKATTSSHATRLTKASGYAATGMVREGASRFASWYRSFYGEAGARVTQ